MQECVFKEAMDIYGIKIYSTCLRKKKIEETEKDLSHIKS